MKKYLIVAAIFIATASSGQDKFFQIIALKGDVAIDSLPAICGQKIDKPEQILTVGKGSYASVLTSTGYAFQLGRGKHKVNRILDQTISNLKQLKNSHSGAVNRVYPDGIKILSVGYFHETPYLGGDTLTVIWGKKPAINTFSVVLSDFLETVLVDTTVLGNVLTVDVQNLVKANPIVFQVKSGKLSSRQMLVKTSPELEHFKFDITCATSLDFIERELLLAGLCEIYDLYYDLIHHLHNLYAYNKKTRIKISHAYYYRMLEELEFEKFFTEQP
jgi:hypothetical protein